MKKLRILHLNEPVFPLALLPKICPHLQLIRVSYLGHPIQYELVSVVASYLSEHGDPDAEHFRAEIRKLLIETCDFVNPLVATRVREMQNDGEEILSGSNGRDQLWFRRGNALVEVCQVQFTE